MPESTQKIKGKAQVQVLCKVNRELLKSKGLSGGLEQVMQWAQGAWPQCLCPCPKISHQHTHHEPGPAEERARRPLYHASVASPPLYTVCSVWPTFLGFLKAVILCQPLRVGHVDVILELRVLLT